MKDTQVLLYTSYLHQIGGIETFVLNFIEHLHDHYDITLMSERIPDDMAVRIAKLCRVIDRAEWGEIQATGFSCNVLVMIRLTDEIPSFVTYDKSIRMCHASKIPEGYTPLFDCDEMVPVSEAANDCIGRPDNATVIHNLLKTDARKSLLLVSATRLPAQDKGKHIERMLRLANMLHDAEIPFIWLIFSDINLPRAPREMICVGTSDAMQTFIAKADYLVQLSDQEGFCYSVAEALANQTAVIVTPFTTTKELGVVDGKNGYIVPFDMNFDVRKLLKVPSFEYKYDNDSIVSQWKKILGKLTPTHSYEPPKVVRIRCVYPYKDMRLGRRIDYGEEYYVKPERAQEIVNAGYAEIIKPPVF